MGKYFVDLNPGDRYSLSYIPGKGTKFYYNGKLQGVIPGKEFGRSLFAVWIGNKPFCSHLRYEILGHYQGIPS